MATRRATYQDVLDAPAHRVAEIVDGTLYISPRPPTLQALAKTRLSAGLGNAFGFGRGGPGGWRIMHEPELHLGEDILVPDVAGWRRERLPRIAETWDAVIAPDWVCETMSDTTRELDLNGKRPVYAREGIPYLWLVDPVDRTLEAFEVHEGQWAANCEREGRRAGEYPSVRCDHLQPGRTLALRGAYSGLLDRSPARIAKQGTVGRGSSPSLGEHRADRPDFRAEGRRRGTLHVLAHRKQLTAR